MQVRRPVAGFCKYTGTGFTLVEVLVAISVMAIMALMAWRGMDSMLRTRASSSTLVMIRVSS